MASTPLSSGGSANMSDVAVTVGSTGQTGGKSLLRRTHSILFLTSWVSSRQVCALEICSSPFNATYRVSDEDVKHLKGMVGT